MTLDFTVIIQYPAWAIAQGTPLFYVAFVSAENTENAVAAAYKEARSAQAPKNRGELSDWKHVFVLDRWACVKTPDSGHEWLSPWR